MYLDGVVILSLIIVTLTCAMITYVGIFAYKHIKSESEKVDAALKKANT